MLKKIRNAFDDWNDLLGTCHKCGGKTESTDHSYLDGHILCEYAIKCKDCKASVGYWAYGNFDGPQTKVESVHHWMLDVRYKAARLLSRK